MTKRKQVSIVVPVFNGENTIEELFYACKSEMEFLSFDFEMIFVDDASRDNSWEKITKLKSNHPDQIVGIKMGRNSGQHMAVICGCNLSKADFVITMDDDLQHKPEDIRLLFAKQKEQNADLVYGVFKQKKGSVVRNAGSFFLRRMSKYTANTIGDGSSFRLMKRELVEKISQHFHSFVFIDEMIYWYTTDITTVSVEHRARKSGRSGYSFFGLLKLFSNILINYTAIPLRIMTWGGVLLSLFSFLLGVWFIFKKFYYQVTVPGFTATIVVILFSTSVMMICMGIIGQYLYKIFNHQMGKPPYNIKKII